MARTGAHELVTMLRRGVQQGSHVLIHTHGGVVQIAAPVAAWVLNHIPVLIGVFVYALVQDVPAPQGMPTHLYHTHPDLLAWSAQHQQQILPNVLNNFAMATPSQAKS